MFVHRPWQLFVIIQNHFAKDKFYLLDKKKRRSYPIDERSAVRDGLSVGRKHPRMITKERGSPMKTDKNISEKSRTGHHPHPVKRPLGRILLDGGFVQPKVLDAALEDQIKTERLLGDVLVDMGIISRPELDAVLWVQRDFSNVQDAIRAAAGIRRMLGELLISARLITPEQLDEALEEQKKTGEKLGEVLVRRGYITRRDLEITLSFQNQMGRADAPTCLSLGQLLVSAGYITHEQLKDALDRQRSNGKKLGEVLVEAGHCEKYHVEHGLQIQSRLVAAALIAALSLAPLNEAASSQTSTQVMSTQIQVTAKVLARASFHVLRQPSEIVVTEADIRRGYMDINAGSLLEIKNNSRAGVMMSFEVRGMPFKEVLVSGMGREVAIGPGGGIITHQLIGTSIVALNYRFVFDKSSQAGTYAWPFSLSVSPVE